MLSDKLVGSALKVPLFYGLPEHQMAALLHRAERVVFYQGEHLIESGSYGDAAYLIVSGHGSEVHPLSPTQRFERIGPGALVGEMAMLIETQHHVDVIAEDTIKAVRFSRDLIQSMMGDSADLADHFVRTIAGRLADLAEEMRAVVNHEDHAGVLPASHDPHDKTPTVQPSGTPDPASQLPPIH